MYKIDFNNYICGNLEDICKFLGVLNLNCCVLQLSRVSRKQVALDKQLLWKQAHINTQPYCFHC
jgi:hypothetical protein